MKKRYWKTLLFAAAFGIGVTSTRTPAAGAQVLNGNGVQVQYDERTGEVCLYGYGTDGDVFQMSRPSHISYPVADQKAVSDFTDFTCRIENGIKGAAGAGNRMVITSVSEDTGLKRTCELETVDEVPGLLYVKTSYQAEGGPIELQQFVDCEFSLYEPQQTVWSYNGGGEGAQSYYDTLQKIDLKDSRAFRRENRQDETSVGIPAADIYSQNGGITVGDASTVRRELKTPVEEKDQTVYASIQRPAGALKAQEEIAAGEGFVQVHAGDYYSGLRGYADGMRQLGFCPLSPEEIPDSSYDLRWESWGWEFDWTLDLILGKLDELKEIGIRQVTLDDGWYNHAGEWGLNSAKLPNGSADMKRLTDAIHSRGMTAVLWWRPCDGGREGSALYKEHPEYFVKNEDGTFGKLSGPGAKNQFNGTTGYALCPLSEGAVQSQVDFVKTALLEWGFDGLKSDYVWSLPHCCNPEHRHARPKESTENQAVFYREIYRAMQECNPDAFHLLCNCGTPQDYYSLPYVTQIPTADPTSVDQTRRRVKAYKALCGDYFPVTTDHNEIWYPSTIGTGAVLIEKRNMSGSNQQEYEKWLAIAAREELHKGQFVGDLYSYGFDPYETYVVNKDGTMYYAFYRDGAKYSPQGNPKVELKGLNPYRLYRIVDYVNNRILATNVPGGRAQFDASFGSYLLLRAEELSAPEPLQTQLTAEESDPAVTFEGAWTAEQNGAFSGGACRYTTETGASVTFAFEGNRIAWYGQKDTNFGTAEVFVDDIPQGEISCSGAAQAGVKLFETSGLPDGRHTIRIVCKTPVIDVDYFSCAGQVAGGVASASNLFSYASLYQADRFAQGMGWETFAAARSRLGALLAQENSGMEAIVQAEDALYDALLSLRRAAKKELIGSSAILPQETEAEGRDIAALYRILLYAEQLDMQKAIPAVRLPYQNALETARQVFVNPQSGQKEINRAWAELLNQIQYAGYTAGSKTKLTGIAAECRGVDLSLYQNTQAFERALKEAADTLSDENALDSDILSVTECLLAERAKLQPKNSDPDEKKQAPGQVTGVKATPQKTGVKAAWQAQAGAVSYQVFIYKNGKWQLAGTTAGNTLQIKKLKSAEKCRIKVIALNEAGTGAESAVVYTATKPGKPNVKNVKKYQKTGLKITCKKNGETGFEVWVKTGKKAYKKAASGSKTVVLKKGIRTGKNVSVKVRGYVKNKNTKVYGAFRQVKIPK